MREYIIGKRKEQPIWMKNAKTTQETPGVLENQQEKMSPPSASAPKMEGSLLYPNPASWAAFPLGICHGGWDLKSFYIAT